MNEQIQPSKGAPLFNPWSPEFIANPYPAYHLLRETFKSMRLRTRLFMFTRVRAKPAQRTEGEGASANRRRFRFRKVATSLALGISLLT